jgi:hypothetical protein
MRYLLLSLLFFCLSCAHHPEPWTPGQKTLATTYTILHTVDWMQTNSVFKEDGYHEINPLIDYTYEQGGLGCVALYFAASLAATLSIAHILPGRHRAAWLALSSVVKLGLVSHNHSIGLNLSLP